MVHVYARVIRVVCQALDSEGIDRPYPTRVALFHDQTAATNGVRAKQREGWPASQDGDLKTHRIADPLAERREARDGT